MKLPINTKQKFQIGDICRIVRADNSFCYPPKKDEDAEGYNCLVVIMYSYAQCFPDINPADTSSFEVYLPQWLNPQKYDKKGWYHGKMWSCQGEMSWAWVHECQLEFVRKPTKEEIKKIITFGEKTRWKEYKELNDDWQWDSYQDLLEHCQEKIEKELSHLIEVDNCIFINFPEGFDKEVNKTRLIHEKEKNDE